MNDEQLTRLFRSLDEAAEPSPDFADALLARLEGAAGAGPSGSRRSVRWLLLAATLVLVAGLGAALAVGAGLLKLPLIVAVESSSPKPSGSPSASPAPSGSSPSTPMPSITPSVAIAKVIATPDGFLAFGSTTGSDGRIDTVLRAPGDGSSWQAADAPDFGWLVDAAGGPSSEIIVAKTSQEVTGSYVVWRSTDGESWTPDPNWTEFGDPQPYSIVAGGAGFLIMGASENPAPNIWTSADGATWTDVGWGGLIAGGFVANDGFLAWSQVDRLLYASGDGVAWQMVSSPADASGNLAISKMFQIGSHVVALTCDSADPAAPCSVWTSTLQGSAGSLVLSWTESPDAHLMNGYGVIAASGSTARGFMWGYDSESYERVAWTSTDGAQWSRTPLAEAALGGGLPAAVSVGPAAAVALGWTMGNAYGAGRELWHSSDGSSWAPANAPTPPPPAAPPGECPSAPTTLAQLLDIGSAKAASCYGQASITVRAYSSDCGGCGGAGFPGHVPSWIAATYAPWYVSTTPTTAGSPGSRMGVWPLPSANLAPPQEGTQVEITGHFNDPISAECRILPGSGEGWDLEPPSIGEAGCRQAFVVTGITVMGG